MKLSDHKGKVVLIDFWADWCGFCRQAHRKQLALAERMKNRPFVIFGVNADDDREAAKRGVARAKLTWRSLWDADGKVRDAWQVDGSRASTCWITRASSARRSRACPIPVRSTTPSKSSSRRRKRR